MVNKYAWLRRFYKYKNDFFITIKKRSLGETLSQHDIYSNYCIYNEIKSSFLYPLRRKFVRVFFPIKDISREGLCNIASEYYETKGKNVFCQIEKILCEWTKIIL